MATNQERHGIPAGAGDSVAIGGLGVVYKISGNQTGGAFAIVEHPLLVGALAGPPHTHTHEDEMSLVLEGEIGVQLGDEVFTAPTGAYVVKPRGVPHTFWNAGSTPARIQEIITPAGFEEYFREVAAALAPGGPPDVAKLMEVAGRYGLVLHMDRLGEVMETHGVRFEGR
jgi:quercetin dioxygenase-like cupin family protein